MQSLGVPHSSPCGTCEWAKFEKQHQSASININEHQWTSININQHQSTSININQRQSSTLWISKLLMSWIFVLWADFSGHLAVKCDTSISSQAARFLQVSAGTHWMVLMTFHHVLWMMVLNFPDTHLPKDLQFEERLRSLVGNLHKNCKVQVKGVWNVYMFMDNTGMDHMGHMDQLHISCYRCFPQVFLVALLGSGRPS